VRERTAQNERMEGMGQDTEATKSQQGQYESQTASTSEDTCTTTEQPRALLSRRTKVHTDLHRYPRQLRSRCHQTVTINLYARAPSLLLHPSTAGTCDSPANVVLEGPIRLHEPLAAGHRHKVAAAAQPPLRAPLAARDARVALLVGRPAAATAAADARVGGRAGASAATGRAPTADGPTSAAFEGSTSSSIISATPAFPEWATSPATGR